MTVLDHILKFTDESAARSTLIVLDREASAPGTWAIVWVSSVVNPEDVGPIRFETVYLGSQY